jgi:hypothetical protein
MIRPVRPAGEDREPSTTSGTIAVVNLHAQIEGLAVRVLRGVRASGGSAGGGAVLQAERGEVAEAERLFAEARRRYRGISPRSTSGAA